jgi:hypothetical protein
MHRNADPVVRAGNGTLFGLLIEMGAARLHRHLRDPTVEATLTLPIP